MYAAATPTADRTTATVHQLFERPGPALARICSGVYGANARLARVPAGTRRGDVVAFDEVEVD